MLCEMPKLISAGMLLVNSLNENTVVSDVVCERVHNPLQLVNTCFLVVP